MNKATIIHAPSFRTVFSSIAAGFSLAMKKFCQQEGLPESLAEDYKIFEKAKIDFKKHKITKAELEKLKRQLRIYIRVLTQYLQRKKFLGIEKSKIRFIG